VIVNGNNNVNQAKSNKQNGSINKNEKALLVTNDCDPRIEDQSDQVNDKVNGLVYGLLKGGGCLDCRLHSQDCQESTYSGKGDKKRNSKPGTLLN
jgi:hypothetical protein